MQKTYRIGMFGLSFSSPNLGCSALAYAFRELIIKALEESDSKLCLTLFSNVDCSSYRSVSKDWVEENVVRYSFKDVLSLQRVKSEIARCDVVFDFTEGDSFSDIYGLKRFVLTSYFKMVAVKKAGRFIFGPQTYGPFKNKFVELAAAKLLKSADRVYARDEKSSMLIKKISGVDAFATTDVAFALPKDNVVVSNKTKPTLGINVSGLLWTGGYNSSNQFGLSVDYRQYIFRLIDNVLKRGYEIHLIPHVVGDLYPECDSPVCREIAAANQQCILAPDFESPMEAKGYISNLDIFTGARMHATIGAFSSGVATIPFSYSPKFEGLYESIGYPYCVNGRSLSTDEALELTSKYLDSIDELRKAQDAAIEKTKRELSLFLDDLRKQTVL